MFHAGTTFAFIRAIAIENDTDANELIDILDGLCEIEDYIPRSTPLLAIKSIDLYADSIDDSRNLEFVTVGYRNLPNYVIIDSNALFAESSVMPLIPLLGAQAMLYQEWRDTKDAERAEFDSASQRSIDGEPGLSSWVPACIISRLADMRYGQFVTLNALDSERAFFYRDNRILLD